MKVDTIETKFGNIDIEYSVFTKGFFIKTLPVKFKEIAGLKILTSRDNSFGLYSELEKYVKDLVKDACIDFQFNRKVICYLIRESSDYTHSLTFEYMICNESIKNQSYMGKENGLCEYYVLESNIPKYIGQRNIFGQIASSSSSNFIIIDYDEQTHLFMKNFSENFTRLRRSLIEFFDKDNLQINISNNLHGIALLGSGSNNESK